MFIHLSAFLPNFPSCLWLRRSRWAERFKVWISTPNMSERICLIWKGLLWWSWDKSAFSDWLYFICLPRDEVQIDWLGAGEHLNAPWLWLPPPSFPSLCPSVQFCTPTFIHAHVHLRLPFSLSAPRLLWIKHSHVPRTINSHHSIVSAMWLSLGDITSHYGPSLQGVF